jgi:polar amino acid transport system substrate-binding protein
VIRSTPAHVAAVILASLVIADTGRAQPHDDGTRPLAWAADIDGGIPYIFIDENGDLAGFEVDLKDALERELGRKINFVKYEFESMIQGVLRKDFDFAMNGLEITPERKKVVRFSRPYFLYQLQFVVPRDETRIRTLEDCKRLNISVGTLAGSQAENLLKENEIATIAFKGQDEIYQKLCEAKEIQAVLLDVPVNLYYAAPDATLPYSQAQKYPGLKFSGQPFAEGFYGTAVHPDNEKLAGELDAAIDRLQKSGKLKAILQKWELWNADQYRLYTDTSPAAQAKEMPFSVYFPMLVEGALVTVEITVLSFLLAVALGLPIALMRLYGPAPVRLLATIYVEFFRGIPVLMLLFFLYFGLPGLVPDFRLGAMEAAILGFGMNYAAYESEIYRAGISSIPQGQWEAAASLGMSPALTFRRIILPQAIRVILPPMTNDLVALFKDTSVVSIIALVELSKQYQILTRSGAGYVGIGLTTAALYLIMSVPLGHLSRYLEKRWSTG